MSFLGNIKIIIFLERAWFILLRLIWNFVCFSFTTMTNFRSLDIWYTSIIFDTSRGISPSPWFLKMDRLLLPDQVFSDQPTYLRPRRCKYIKLFEKWSFQTSSSWKFWPLQKILFYKKVTTEWIFFPRWKTENAYLQEGKQRIESKVLRIPYRLSKYAFSVFQRGKNIQSVVTFL